MNRKKTEKKEKRKNGRTQHLHLLEVQIVQSNHLFFFFPSRRFFFLADLPFSITMDVMMMLMTLVIVSRLIEVRRWQISRRCFASDEATRANQALNEGRFQRD